MSRIASRCEAYAPQRTARGESLVELIVALVMLEIGGGAALALALTSQRLTLRAHNGAETDAARWESYRLVETDSSCTRVPTPQAATLNFDATAERPALSVSVRCGQ